LQSWRATFFTSPADGSDLRAAAVMALYLNVFVLVVQSFLKVPALHAMTPTQQEPPFLVAQLIVLALFIWLAIAAVKKFRNEPGRAVGQAA